MIERTLQYWRHLPQLRIKEAAAIPGVGERTIEAALDQMKTRTIGRIRFVTTESFRRWPGKDVTAIKAAEEIDREAHRRAARIIREMDQASCGHRRRHGR